MSSSSGATIIGRVGGRGRTTLKSPELTRHATDLGENAYAAFKAVTEFASHPPENRCVHRDRHSLQCLAGSWLTSFTTEICKARIPPR